MQWKKFLIVAVFAVVLILSVSVLAVPYRVWSGTPTAAYPPADAAPAAGGTAPYTPEPSSVSTGGLDLSGLKKVSAGTGTGTGTGTGKEPVAAGPIVFSFIFFETDGTTPIAAVALPDFKTRPRPFTVQITPIDPQKHLYVNSSGVSCQTIADSINAGLVAMTSAKVPWYERLWNKTKQTGSGIASSLGGTYAESVASFKKGDWAIGTGQAVGISIGELVLGAINLGKGTWTAGKTIVFSAGQVIKSEKGTAGDVSSQAPQSYSSFKITEAATQLPLPPDIATDGTIYIVSSSGSDLLGKNSWKISSVDGTPLESAKGKKFTLVACQLDKDATSGKLIVKAKGEQELEFGKIACTDLLGCLIEADKRFVGDLFQ